MRTPIDLSSADAKWKRAQLHAKELLDNVGIWTNDDDDPPIRVGVEHDLKKRRSLVYVESIKEIPPGWSLILGDALHDYRAALNYVIGALIRVGHKPDTFNDPDSLFQFPICEATRRDFFKSSHRGPSGQLPGVHVKYLRALSPFQPYKRRRERWILSAIKELNDLDKHREPALATHHVAFQVAAMGFGYGDSTRVADWKTLRPRGRVEPGAKLGHFIWLTDQKPIIKVKPYGPLTGQPDVTVYFHPGSAVVLEDLQPRIVLIRDFVNRADTLIEAVIRKVREV